MSQERLLRVAVAQCAWQPVATSTELRISLESALARAVRAGAELIALSPGADESLAGLRSDLSRPSRHALALDRELRRQYEDLGSWLARAFGVVLALGPALLSYPEGPRRVACLFGAKGELLGTQVQTHRSPAERALGLVRGTSLAPIATPLGQVGLVSGADVEYPEVSRILCLQGAEILVHQAALEHFGKALALSRLWREVQANQVFGLEAYAVGPGLRGRSAIHAPLEITPGHTGWLARAPTDSEPSVVTAELDFLALRKPLASFPIARLRNEAQYRRYLPAVYEAAATQEDGDGQP